MVIDCHVHISAATRGHGHMSGRLQKSIPFRFMRWRLGMVGYDEVTERQLEAKLAETINQTEKLDAVVVLAFDAVHTPEGQLDSRNTHLYVTNDYVMELAARHPKMLFGASVHPYRRDAVAEVERCVRGGAVLLKWLPIVQNFDPADERCIPVYEAMAHFGLPLLSHTGGEKSLPILNQRVADPRLLVPALKRGVKVIAAHCGTRSVLLETDFLAHFMRMARDFEHCYGDTAALNLPTRSYCWHKLLADHEVRRKLVHGSDWPIPSFPPMGLGPSFWLSAMRQSNWMKRDVLIKEALGLEADYWGRGATVLRLPSTSPEVAAGREPRARGPVQTHAIARG